MTDFYRNHSENSVEQDNIWLDFRNGDPHAFQALYQRYFKVLCTYGKRLSPDRQLLEDAIHDVFMDLWRRKEFLSDVDNIRFYLFRALRNRMIRNGRNDVFENSQDIDGFLDYLVSLSSEQHLVEMEQSQFRTKRIQDALGNLSVRQREAIHLRFYNAMSLDEISKLMGISKQCVSNLLHKSIAVLRIKLRELTVVLLLAFALS